MYRLIILRVGSQMIPTVYVATCLCLTLAPVGWFPQDALLYHLAGKKLCVPPTVYDTASHTSIYVTTSHTLNCAVYDMSH